MDRRRALSQRPPSTEETQCWSHAAGALTSFSELYRSTATADTISHVNELLSVWPQSGDDSPMDGTDSVKNMYKKLNAGLKQVRSTSESEVKALEQAIESLDVLIALRSAPEKPILEKRNKRPPRGSSPASTPPTPSLNPINRVTLNVKGDRDRASEGPLSQPPFKRDVKSRARFYSKQNPLQEGRKVAFQTPSSGKGEHGDGEAEADDGTWILAVVTKVLNQDKARYEVQDAEPQEDGQPGQCYPATMRSMIPLPDPDAPPSSLSHLSQYHEFSAGSAVLALYPDTSCFYRAQVIQGPRETQNTRTAPLSKQAAYRLRFEDDDDQIHSVAAQWVVEYPG